MKTSVTPFEVVELLNDALKTDPAAVKALVGQRVPCNKELAEHPTIQVLSVDEGQYKIGLLGFLNGMFGLTDAGRGAIEAIEDDATHEITGFRVGA
jgi:hypothetical protein